jgi:T5SS/PEP-CTERM-associated repeat protein/autotransporter-associated beta strand protein
LAVTRADLVRRLAVCAALAWAAADAPASVAQNVNTWISPNTGDLLVGSNWDEGVAPNGPDQYAIIGDNLTSAGSLSLTGTITLWGLIYDNSGARSLVSPTPGVGKLIFQAASGNALFQTLPGSGRLTPNPSLHSLVLNSTTNFTIEGNNTVEIYPTISGSGGLSKSGPTDLYLNASNTYTGVTTVRDGNLRIQHANALGAISSHTEVMGAGINSTGRLELAGDIAFAFEPLQLRGRNNDISHLVNVSGSNTWNGPITLNTDASSYYIESEAGLLTLASQATISPGSATTGTRTIHLRGAGNGVANGVISQGGTATYALIKSGSGTWTLGGNNTYTGATTISGGTLRLGASNRIDNVSAVSVTSGTFDLNNFSEAIGSLAGSGNVTLGSGTLTPGVNNTSTTFSGVMSGTGGLTKVGTGVLTLSGNNTYTGATTISGGTLRLGASNRIADGSAVSVTGTFNLNNFSETIGSLSGGGSVTLGSGTLTAGGNNTSTTFSGVISGTGGLTKTGTGTLTMTGNNAGMFTGTTTVNSGTFRINGGTFSTRNLTKNASGTLDLINGVLEIDDGNFDNGGALFSFQGATAGQTATFRLTNTATGAAGEMRVGNTGPFGSGRFELLDGSTLSSTLARIATQANSSGSALVDGAGSVWTTGTMRLGEGGVGSLTVQNGGNVNVTSTNVTSVAVGHTAIGTGTLLVTGSGTTFTTATGGDMVIGNNGSTGTVTVASGGLVDIADVTTIGAVGRLNLQGGTLSTRSFTHTLGGTLDFDEGTLEIDGGTFNNNVSIFSFQGDAAGKTVTFRLTNDATGAAGEMRVGNTGPFGSGRFDLLDGSTFSSTLARIATQANSSGSALVDAGSVWTTENLRVGEGGAGSLTVQNDGDVNVTATNTASVRIGDNTVGTGTLLVTGSGSTLTTATGGDLYIGHSNGTGTLTVANSGLVDVADLTHLSNNGRLNLQGGTLSTRSFTHTSTGILDLDDGTLEIDGGTFNIAGASFFYNGDAAGKTVTFQLKNNASGSAGEFRVGHSASGGSGAFALESGADFSSTLARIATNAGSSGSALVDGAGSVWTTENLRVGEGGAGSLTVRNGGDVNVTAMNTASVRIGDDSTMAIGTLLVTGSGSTFTTATGGDMVIGNVGSTGTVTVANGGLVDIADVTTIGAAGLLRLQGGTFRTGSFTHNLGGQRDFDDGFLEIDGGTFNIGVTNWAFQGDASGKTVTFRLVNGATGTSDDLEIGQLGNIGAGAFELKSGSTFTSDLARIARNGGSSGSALVDGAGSVWTTGTMRVGEGGVGSLTVQNGGDVNVTNTNVTSVTVNHTATGTGTLLVTGSGSTLTTATGGAMAIGNNGGNGIVTVANGGLVDVDDTTTIGVNGRLNIHGGTLRTQNLTHNLGGTLDFVSGTLHVDNFVGDLVNQGGTVAPGNSPGITTITGNYTQQEGATLQIEVASYSGPPAWVPGVDHDQLQVTGTAWLGGRLEVPIIDPLKTAGGPTIGLPQIEFLTAPTVEGEFNAVVAPGLDPNLAVDVDYSSASSGVVRLSFVPIQTNVVFDDDTNTTADWFNPTTTWEDTSDPGTDVLPTLVNGISIQNLTPTAQQVEVEASNAFVAQLTVGGGLDDLTVQIGSGTASPSSGNLSSTLDVTVMDNGVIAMNAGTLATADVTVSGGTVTGNGLIDLSGESLDGTGTLTVTSGTVRPGFTVGHLDIDGAYVQEAAGTLEIELEGTSGAGQIDTIAVTGTAALGGTLRLDVSGFTLTTPGELFGIIDAGGGTGEFDNFETVGGTDPDVFFAPLYNTGLGAGAGSELGGGGDVNCEAYVCVGGYYRGDMNRNGDFDAGDIPSFALALTNALAYRSQFGISGSISGNMDGLGGIDFDDISLFRLIMQQNNVSTAHLAAAIERFSRPNVPEPGSLVIMAIGFYVTASLRRRFA